MLEECSKEIIIVKFKLGRWNVRTWGVVRNMDT